VSVVNRLQESLVLWSIVEHDTEAAPSLRKLAAAHVAALTETLARMRS